MKLRIFFISILLLTAPILALAGEAQDLEKKILMDQKKLIIIRNMTFTESESEKFWPVYEKFQEKLFENSQRFAVLIGSYADVYKNLTDEKALSLVDANSTIQKDRQELMHQFDMILRDILPGKKVFRYLQMESKLQAITKFELSKRIPLAN